MKTIITSGRKYIDIDAYASMIAYRELLKSLGYEDVFATSSATLNESVPDFLRELSYKFDGDVDLSDAKFIVLDVSNPEFLDTIIDDKNIIEIIDHHVGYEDCWRGQDEVKVEIEFIGAICTLIFEKITQAKQSAILTPELCQLLVAGILDNTLNLKAGITTDRDIKAYRELCRIGGISDKWYRKYFMACTDGILKNLKSAILNDMKVSEVSPLLPAAIGQLTILSHSDVSEMTLQEVFNDFDRWMINVISLEDGKSYIYYGSENTGRNLEKLFGKPSEKDGLIILNHFILRKEIIKLALENS